MSTLERLRLRLREERELRGVSQQRVGECCEPPVSRSAVNKWELGLVRMPIDALEAYERALGLPVNLVVGTAVDPRGLMDARRARLADECLAAIEHIPDAEIDAFRLMLRAFRPHP